MPLRSRSDAANGACACFPSPCQARPPISEACASRRCTAVPSVRRPPTRLAGVTAPGRDAPHPDAVGEVDRDRVAVLEDAHVRGPRRALVRALRAVPVVVPRGEQDGPSGAFERAAQELDGVGRDEVVLEQVAAAGDRVGALRLRESDDPFEGATSVGAALRGGPGVRPRERSVEVQVGEVDDPEPHHPEYALPCPPGSAPGCP